MFLRSGKLVGIGHLPNEKGKVGDALDTLEKFPLFSKLAPEIQLRIWEYAMPSAQTINIYPSAPNSLYDPDFIPDLNMSQEERCAMYEAVDMKTVTFSSNSELCSLLSVCTISRSEVLKAFPGCIDMGGGKIIRFNPTHDKILIIPITKYLGLPPLPGYQEQTPDGPDYKAMFQEVKHLELHPCYCPSYFSSDVELYKAFFANFTALETLTMVCVEADRIRAAKKQGQSIRLVPYEDFDASQAATLEQIFEDTRGIELIMSFWPQSLIGTEEGVDSRDWTTLKVSMVCGLPRTNGY